jgi:capsular polysaccharide biosynthesis protein
MNEHEDEIQLIDYLNVIWKRKWLIIIPTFFCVVLTGIISFLLPKIWEIDAIIQPSKFLVQTGEGKYEEVMVIDPKQIAGQINQASYNQLIAAELNLDIRTFPKLKAENLRDTKLVRIAVREEDVAKAKSILYSLFNHLKGELDKKIDIEINNIDTEIKNIEIEKEVKRKEISTLGNKLKIIEKREIEIIEEMKETKGRIEAIEREQLSTLKKENKSESETLGLLLYSTEIQQSLRYINSLNELLSEKKLEQENINQKSKENEQYIERLNSNSKNLIERKGRMDYAKLIKEPTSSLSPVSPRKKFNVLIAGILGSIIFTMLAFFIEYIEKQKAIKK